MFKQLDPRVRLVWWLVLSALAMIVRRSESMAVLILIMVVAWQSVDGLGRLAKFTLGLLPFLVIISIISLFPSMDVMRSAMMALRYFLLLGSTTLVMSTTTYGEITGALRNIGRGRLRFLSRPLELFSLLFGLSFLTVPIAGEEWQAVREVQRARGVDLALGSRLEQVRRGLELVQPLILRILDRVRSFGISIIILGYDPFGRRTLYRELALARRDHVVLWASLALVAVAIALRVLYGI